MFIQALLLFFYPAIISRLSHNRRSDCADAAMTIASGIFVAAPIPMAGQILKDVVLTGATLCLFGVLDLSSNSTKHKRAWLSVKLAILVLILTVRPTNFLMLAVAGGIYAFFIFGVSRKWLLAVFLILVACTASIPVLNYIDRNVLSARSAAEEDSLIIFDVAGISSDIKQNLFAQLPGWPANEIQPWECYTPKRWDSFKWGACKQYAELFDTTMHQSSASPSELLWWFGNILHHPLSYIKHRILYTIELFKNAHPIFGWGLPGALNTQKNIDQISGAITHGIDTGGMTRGIDMTRKIQMWEPTIALVPFDWFSARVFSRQISFVWGLFFCVSTLLWSWRIRRVRQEFNSVVVVSSAIGLGNVLMLMAFGVADEGRYLVVTLVCGIVSLLRTIHAELEARKAATSRT